MESATPTLARGHDDFDKRWTREGVIGRICVTRIDVCVSVTFEIKSSVNVYVDRMIWYGTVRLDIRGTNEP
jgi:hypothetical protein